MGNVASSPAPSAIPTPVNFKYHQEGRDWKVDADGDFQSPIDIIPHQSEISNESMKMEFFLTDHPLNNLKVQDNGATLMVEGGFSKLKATDVNGEAYDFEALQFHFHAPSEHTINGGFYELELHIVHQMTPESEARAKTKRNLAVIAVFFQLDKSKAHPFFDALNLKNVGTDISLNMNELFGGDLVDGMKYFAYQGSLTTPPCTENANFYVFEKPLPISQEQLDQFNLRWKDNPLFANGHGNNRPVQPLNGRVVKQSCNCCVKGRSHEHHRRPQEVIIPQEIPSFEMPQPFPAISYSKNTLINNPYFTGQITAADLTSYQEKVESAKVSQLTYYNTDTYFSQSLNKYVDSFSQSDLGVDNSKEMASVSQSNLTNSQTKNAIYYSVGQVTAARLQANSGSKFKNLFNNTIGKARLSRFLKHLPK